MSRKSFFNPWERGWKNFCRWAEGWIAGCKVPKCNSHLQASAKTTELDTQFNGLANVHFQKKMKKGFVPLDVVLWCLAVYCSLFTFDCGCRQVAIRPRKLRSSGLMWFGVDASNPFKSVQILIYPSVQSIKKPTLWTADGFTRGTAEAAVMAFLGACGRLNIVPLQASGCRKSGYELKTVPCCDWQWLILSILYGKLEAGDPFKKCW